MSPDAAAECERCGRTDCPGCEEPDTCRGPDGHWYVITYGRARYQIHARDCEKCQEEKKMLEVTEARAEATRVFTEAVEAVGGTVTQRLAETEEPQADTGHVNCTLKAEMPNGKRYWLEIECWLGDDE